MPISIPMMQRRPSGADLAGDASGGGASGARGGTTGDFVPPHVLYRQESEVASGSVMGLGAEASMGGLSPTTAAKREKLLARNAILRSTGFIEVQHSAPVVIGESRRGRSGVVAGTAGGMA